MKAAWAAFGWEILCKNRVVFGSLAGLLGLAAVTAGAAGHAAPNAWWLEPARNLVFLTFLTSMLLGAAPFLLMESSGGWRMNSMITRWFVLPVRTVFLVLLPALAGAAFLAGLVAVWMPVLERLTPGLDAWYFASVLVAGLTAVQALAWTVPRKPGQFWIGVALLFPVVLILSLVPQDQPDNGSFRQRMLLPLTGVTLLGGAFAVYAAHRNRCGDWPGELPVDRAWEFLRQGGGTCARRRDFRSAGTALFGSETLPSLRLLVLSWVVTVLALFLFFSLQSLGRQPRFAFSMRLLGLIALNVLPMLGIGWLALWGLFAGCEPAAGFRTRLSAFRSALPLTSGTLAGQRLLTLGLGWAVVWLLPVVLVWTYDPAWSGYTSKDGLESLQTLLARWMGFSAQAAVGALPVILWGRFEGFPNLLLAAVCSWAAAWLVGANLHVEHDPGWLWLLAAGLLVVKFGAATWACARGLRGGHITWRFAAGLLGSWLALAAFLVFGLPTWQRDGAYASLTLLVLLPLARLAWCPLAVAANRHR